jgi:hypothetical protein
MLIKKVVQPTGFLRVVNDRNGKGKRKKLEGDKILSPSPRAKKSLPVQPGGT